MKNLEKQYLEIIRSVSTTPAEEAEIAKAKLLVAVTKDHMLGFYDYMLENSEKLYNYSYAQLIDLYFKPFLKSEGC